ncbi:acetolactate synthase-1/2/3 large subunit [Brevibacterium siliguriense]|uniref:Acetolactate synthase-1/2/3 large subunit n=1 Tax=Brevibacterium siliguriense TaxID=1136497 RepID=A0A1H1QGT1_9MICO|nr:thiamine pyrophosphate-binding protein [Brevibacterium siliguriense]SDS22523.1 acetolactate synthase-1/2/3 large subunit [Brevibacterium siliguriense]
MHEQLTKTEKRRTTGWVVMEALRSFGVDTVFGIPGTHNLEFYRPLEALGIRAVTARHEQGAGYAADGWSLQTGLPGVVLTTSGPGLLNALSAAGTAFCESRPMIILAPGPARGAEFADAGTLHETKDQLAAASAIVEWGRRVSTAAEAVTAVHDAFALFSSSRPRPVYIEIPLDLLVEVTDLDEHLVTARTADPVPLPPEQSIAEAAKLLSAAHRPVILAGGGARGAAGPIRKLAEQLAAPVVTSLNGKGVLDEHHPLSLGSNLRLNSVREHARNADVLLVIGAKLGDAELWVDRLDAQGTVIRIDILDTQIDKNQTADLGLVGDANAVVTAIVESIGAAPTLVESPNSDVEELVVELLAAAQNECAELSPVNTAISADIASALPADAIVATDSSQIAYGGLLNTLKVVRANSTPYMGTFATLGYGLPAALGARIGAPHRPSFVVIGDGALMFSVQEFITVVEQDEDVTVIVLDNGGYGEIRANEADISIAPIGVDLVQPDWPALAQAFGGNGRHVNSTVELAAAVDTALSMGGLQLIHLDPTEYTSEENK